MKQNFSPQKIVDQIQTQFFGKPEIVKLAVACFLGEGHLLIDDIPGVGKTTLGMALAKSIGGEFQRIQFTSDLLPSDLIGVSVYNQSLQDFEFKKGPLFHNVVLSDEINRSSPKTQSALLEAMQDGQVSLDNQTHRLPNPFFVIATQNPHEHHGTFPLPESQLDRFMMKIHIGYPDPEVESKILKGTVSLEHGKIEPVCQPTELLGLLEFVRNIAVEESLDRYIINIANATRNTPHIDLGLSPRGTIAMRRAAQGFAAVQKRDYVIPDDIKTIAPYVMGHRIRWQSSEFNGNTQSARSSLIWELIDQVPVPV